MKWSVKQVMVMVASFLCTVALLKAGQWVYTNSAIRTPLVQTIQSVSGVSRAQMRADNTLVIWIKSNADLMTTYHGVQAKASAALGKAPQNIVIMGNPTPAMTRMSQTLRFVIAQGESTGQYVAMNQSIKQDAQRANMSASAELGNYSIYLTLRQGNHRLYQVVPITLEGGGGHG